MSREEIHKGLLRQVAIPPHFKTRIEKAKYVIELFKPSDYDLFEYTDEEKAEKGWEDEVHFYSDFIFIGDLIYHLDDEELEDDYGTVVSVDDEGDIHYKTKFYNGSSSLSENIEEAVLEMFDNY